MRRGQVNSGPGVQMRATDATAAVIGAIAKAERRTLKDQTEILVIAGAKSLGYNVDQLVNQ